MSYKVWEISNRVAWSVFRGHRNRAFIRLAENKIKYDVLLRLTLEVKENAKPNYEK